jgi:ribosomal-protein-alanine N-acetyltransferase
VAEEIRTERLLLRRARYDDAPSMHRIMVDAQAMRYWSSLPHDSFEQTESWVASMVEADPLTSDDFIVTRGGELIGKLGGWQLPEIGFLFAPSHWGHGYASEALGAFIERRRRLGSTELTADVDPRNHAALKLLNGSNFKAVGRVARTFQLGDEWCDSVYLRLRL